jgi:FSR family fosmidomycin resistance protein-like MFS transporter
LTTAGGSWNSAPGMASPKPPFRLMSSLGHCVSDLYSFVLPLVLPLLLTEFSLSYRLAGLVLACYLGIVSLLSYLFGRLSDRFSPWILVGGGFLLASAGFLGAGSSQALPAAFACLAAAAVGASTFHPVIYALIDRLTLRRQGATLGMFEFWGGVAIVVMYMAGGLLQRRLGWRGVLTAVGLPGVAMGALFLRYARSSLASPEHRDLEPREPPRTGALLFFLSSCALRFLAVTAVINFMPTYLSMGRGLPPSLAAYAAGLQFAGGAAVVFWGRAADRAPPLSVLSVASGALAPLILLLSLPLPLWAALPALVLCGAFQGGCSPAQNLLLSFLGSRLGSGAVFGILLATLSLIGALSPGLFGLLADHLGLQAAMRLFALPALASWLVLQAFGRTSWRRLTAALAWRK